MPKYPRTFLSIAMVFAATVLAPATGAADDPDPRAAYDRLLSLAGNWTGRMEDPLFGPPVTVRYEVVSGGGAIIEYQDPGQSLELVTVYYLASGELRATQYSGAGNQPAFRLGKDSTTDLALFEFDAGTGFDPDQDGHVHQGEIRFISNDRIEQRWFHYVGPREQGVTHWFLDREQPSPPAEAAPVAPAAPPAPETPAPAAT